jgi:hypothetical protein
MAPASRLLFYPASGQWWLARDADRFAVTKRDALEVLAAVLPLSIVTGRAHPETKAGVVAELHCLDDHVELRLESAETETIEELRISRGDLPVEYADWIWGAFPDRWIAPKAVLRVIGDAQVMFDLYMPPIDSMASKQFDIRLDGQTLASSEVPRGAVFRTPAIQLSGVSNLWLTSGYAEPVQPRDRRARGFVVSKVILNDVATTPFVVR